MAISCQNSRDSFTFSCDPQLILTDSLIGFVYEQIQSPEFDIGQYLDLVPTTDQNADPEPGQETVLPSQAGAEPKPAQVTVPTVQYDAEPKPAVYEKIQSPEFDIDQYLNRVPTTDQNADTKSGQETVPATRHSAEPKPAQIAVPITHHDSEPKPEVYAKIQTPEFDIGQYLNPVPTTDQDADRKPGQETVLETQQDAELKPAQAEVTVPTTHDAEPEPAVYEEIEAPEFDIGQHLKSVPTTSQNADLIPGQETVLETQHDAEPKSAQVVVSRTQYNAEPKPAQIMVPTIQHNAEPKPAQVMVPTTQYNVKPKPAQVMVPTTQYNSEPKPAQIMVPTSEYNAELNPPQVMVLTTQNSAVHKSTQVPMFNSSQLTAPSLPSTEPNPAQVQTLNSSNLTALPMPILHQDSFYANAQNLCEANIQFTPGHFVQYQHIYNSQLNTAYFTNPVHIPYQNPRVPVRPITGRAHGVVAPAFKPATSQSVAARVRRKKISDKTQELASLIPGGTRMNTADMLSVAYKYVNFLKAQIGILAMMDSEEAREVPLTVEGYMRSLLGSTSVQEYLSAHGKCLVPKKLAMNLAKEMESNVVVSSELKRFVESIKNN